MVALVIRFFKRLMLTVSQAEAKAAAEAEAAAEVAEAKAYAEAKAAAILKDNSKACTMLLSGVEGINSHINGRYLATQERGQDGRTLYRKTDDDQWCIEHFAGEWQVKAEFHRGSGLFAASVEGDCALEDCGLRKWRVYNSKNRLMNQPSVMMLTEREANSKASGAGNFAHNTKAL